MKYWIIGIFSVLAVVSFVSAGILYFVKDALVSHDLLKNGWVRTAEGLWTHSKVNGKFYTTGEAEEMEQVTKGKEPWNVKYDYTAKNS